ncbi:MAG: hypothetical protein IJG38_01440 [Thermoguttaceae bacterium]|nr:hypothetical protein [Thermoguttaceae bacterium]
MESRNRLICSDEKTTVYFTTYSQRILQHRENLQYLPDNKDNNGLSLENKGYYKMKKAPASGCKGLELGNRDLNPD